MAGRGAAGNGHSVGASRCSPGPSRIAQALAIVLATLGNPPLFFCSLFRRVSREGCSKLWETDWGIYFVSLSKTSMEVVKGVDSLTKQLRACFCGPDGGGGGGGGGVCGSTAL